MVGGYSPLPLLKFVWWQCYALPMAVLRAPKSRAPLKVRALIGRGLQPPESLLHPPTSLKRQPLKGLPPACPFRVKL